MMENEFNNTPECSIIIVNFRDYKLIYDCIDSVIKYTSGVSFEIILVDNSSTGSEIDRLKEKYSGCLRVIKNNENLGFAKANNQGIQAAKGKYLLLLNNDTIFIENTIKSVFEFAESNGENLIVGCKILNPDMTHQISVVEFDGVWNSFTENFFLYKLLPKSKYFNKYYQNYIDYKDPVEVDAVKGCFLFCLKKTAEELGGLDERFYFYMEETDFCYRFKQNGGGVFYFPKTSIIHLGGATADKMQWFKFKSQSIAKVKFYQKHFKGLKFFLTVFLHYTGVALRVIVYFLMGILGIKINLLVKSYYYFRQLFVYPKNLFEG